MWRPTAPRPAAPAERDDMLPAIAFPAIDPVALELGPLVIRWYALA
jgi:hypothetical protein